MKQSSGRVSRARLVAYEVLQDVDERDAYANLALPKHIRDARLDARDAAFVTELVSATLRFRGKYDHIISLAAGRPIEQIDARTLRVLRLGVHQVLSMRTAVHAALNESVELQKRVGQAAAAGFVNGVLRTVSRSSHEQWESRISEQISDDVARQAVLTSHPAWVIRALNAALSAEHRSAELNQALLANNEAPIVNVVLLTDELNPQHESELYEALSPAGPSPIGFTVNPGKLREVLESQPALSGNLRVQDQGSQVAALALTSATPIAEGEHWLDLCAGPGGKTAILANESRRHQATLRANEISEHRAKLVRDSVRAWSSEVEIVNFDGRDALAYGDHLFDRILIDAPCSGLGALRRRPDARWRKELSDLAELNQLQTQLLNAAAEHLQVGGVIAYVTCSPVLAETRVVVDEFLGRHTGFLELNARQVIEGIATEHLDLSDRFLSAQLWPHRNATDAMFVSLLQKTS